MTKEQCFKCKTLKFEVIEDGYVGCVSVCCDNDEIKVDKRCEALTDSLMSNLRCAFGPQ